MGIKPNRNNKTVIRQVFQEASDLVEEVIVRNLKAAGEYGLSHARRYGAYQDQTGNLRSSLGYIIAKDGEELYKAGFDPSENKGTEGEKGAEDGYAYAQSLIAEIKDKYCLVFVAGMFYASYVESEYQYSSNIETRRTAKKYAYDVLTSAEIHARDKARELFEALAKEVNG